VNGGGLPHGGDPDPVAFATSAWLGMRWWYRGGGGGGSLEVGSFGSNSFGG